ncbi:ATP-binding protein [Helicobacter sp. MIT 99-5507]|uniref:ATP-binding protein n=1 Tax=Helicobacter sp. MIT 99-5507 TaxID=152489 RepID=UPI0015F1A708|nr:ATP-binding protein [Helicobacter sp. MIT 99-5507]
MYGDKKLLEDCIYNLCDNAIKYNKPKGSVHVSMHKNEHSVILSVQDTGIGIPKDSKDRVFERFIVWIKAEVKPLVAQD